MERLRQSCARWFTLAGLFAWVIASTVAPLHVYLVEHTVCEDHGETIEVGDDDTESPDPGDEEHEHGCSLTGFVIAGLADAPAVQSAPQAIDIEPSTVEVVAHAPRGPPLAYAPKTSPPARL